MLFYPFERLDEIWKIAKTAYNNNQLICVSTIAIVHSGRNNDGCLQFSVGGTKEKLSASIMSILAVFKYYSKIYVYYKGLRRDEPTASAKVADSAARKKPCLTISSSSSSGLSSSSAVAENSSTDLDQEENDNVSRDEEESQTREKKYTFRVRTEAIRNGRFYPLP